MFGLTGTTVGGAATVNAAGSYTFSPATGFSGSGGFVYQVTDSSSCLATAPVTVSVDSLSTNTGSILTCVPSFTSDLGHFVNGGSGALSFTGPLSSTCGTISIASNGTFSYSAPSGYTGTCDFVYGVTDALGCASTGAIAITNDTPTAATVAVNDCADTTISGSLVGLFNGVPPATFSLTGAVLNGTALVGATGIYSFSPTPGYSGLAGFIYEAVDVNGCAATGGIDVIVSSPIAGATAINTCFQTPVAAILHH